MKHNKDYYNRRNEILNIAHDKFVKEGFQATSVSSIMNDLDIAKGTFYHYFKSKDEVLNIIINRSLDEASIKMKSVCNDKEQSLMNKFQMIISLFSNFISELLRENNTVVHNEILFFRIMKQSLNTITPIIASILTKEMNQNKINISNPKETAELIVCLTCVIVQKKLLRNETALLDSMFYMIYSILYKEQLEIKEHSNEIKS